MNPLEVDREDADGEEEEELEDAKPSATSIRHVWIDMSKPMPRPKVVILILWQWCRLFGHLWTGIA